MINKPVRYQIGRFDISQTTFRGYQICMLHHWFQRCRRFSKNAVHHSSLKSNSHQMIFPTDYHRLPPIWKLVVVCRFYFKEIVWCDMEMGGVIHQRFKKTKIGRFPYRFLPTIHLQQLSSMFDKSVGANDFS